jgi:hypothetical protein
MYAVAVFSLISLAIRFRTEYKADDVALADSLASYLLLHALCLAVDA